MRARDKGGHEQSLISANPRATSLKAFGDGCVLSLGGTKLACHRRLPLALSPHPRKSLGDQDTCQGLNRHFW